MPGYWPIAGYVDDSWPLDYWPEWGAGAGGDPSKGKLTDQAFSPGLLADRATSSGLLRDDP